MPNKIWKKLAFGAIFIVVLTLLATNFIQLKYINSVNDQEMKEDLESLATVASLALEQPLWNLNKDSVESITNAFFENKAVSQITVFDNSLGILYEKKKTTEEHGEHLLLETERDIILDDQIIGVVQVKMTQYFTQESNRRNIVNQGTEIVILNVLLATLIILSTTQITRPLKGLMEAFGEVGTGNTMKLVEVKTNDEIAELANHFNEMSKNIYDARNAIEQMNEQLEEKVEQRTQELNLKNEDLSKALQDLHEAQELMIRSEKMVLLGKMVAGVTHEINTPVGVSLTMSTYLEETLQKLIKKVESGSLTKKGLLSDFDSFGESISSIVHSLHRAVELINSFKQVAVDQSSHVVRSFNLHEYIDEVLKSLHSQYRKRPITFNIACSDDINIVSYPGAYSQILTNLVMNALIHAYEVEDVGNIEIKIDRIGEQIEFIFTDDGSGMPEGELNKIFDPFFTTKSGEGGSGLGLNVVYNTVINILKGEINCESEVGEGTIFTMIFPYKHPDIDEEEYI